MRVILIEEERFAEVTDLMRAEVEKSSRNHPQGFPEGMSEKQRVMLADQIYRTVHMTFVRWAQSHGASCVKK